tara:strand:- start:44 stop:1015 length:972 start_codon:yes stop_codon:yes gene_type:complete
MAEYLQAPPRRKALGLLADALTSGQEALNTVNLPYVGGLGGLLLGQAPQYLQDVSYGMPAFRGGNVATGGLGTFTPDTRMLDVATLPFVGAGAAKAGQVGAKTLGKEIARQVETGTGILGSNVLDPRQYATAYHGSPYMFDKFDIDKVGTGHGAQSYGQGMYFSENPKVADYFKDRLFPTKEFLQAVDKGEYNDLHKFVTKGNLYKVDIPDTSIPKMLDWDKPLGEQNLPIKDLLSQFKGNRLGRMTAYAKNNDVPAGSFYTALSEELGSQEKATKALQKAGISGVKYLDATSKDLGQGTRNFVVFDPSNVKILERNNQGLLK